MRTFTGPKVVVPTLQPTSNSRLPTPLPTQLSYPKLTNVPTACSTNYQSASVPFGQAENDCPQSLPELLSDSDKGQLNLPTIARQFAAQTFPPFAFPPPPTRVPTSLPSTPTPSNPGGTSSPSIQVELRKKSTADTLSPTNPAKEVVLYVHFDESVEDLLAADLEQLKAGFASMIEGTVPTMPGSFLLWR